MTQLIPELDKLRNKELSFGCVVKAKEDQRLYDYDSPYYPEDIIVHIGDDGTFYTWYDSIRGDVSWSSKEDLLSVYKTIGHPLTAGRIRKLGYDSFAITGSNIIHAMQCIMMDIRAMGLADKTEVERQRHEKRPELKELLIQFSNYL